MTEIPVEFSRWKRVPVLPEAANIVELESPDGLERVVFGSLTGSLTWYRRRSRIVPFVIVPGGHPLDPLIGKQKAKP
jgi:hypothetical protein